MNIPTIETERLRLRAFEERDLEPYAAMYAEERFARFLEGRPLSRAQAWENIALILGHWALRGYGIWAVERQGSGELVGRVGLLNLPGWPDVEICWALSPKHWGSGYATEASRAAIDWAFGAAGLRRLISLIHPDNEASRAVALRLGEQLREQITFQDKPTDVYEILAGIAGGSPAAGKR